MRRQLSLYGDRILAGIVKWRIRAAAPRRSRSRVAISAARSRARIGPLLPAHRIGRANMRAAFPDKDAAWIEATLRDAWDNLGRVAGEYVHHGAHLGLSIRSIPTPGPDPDRQTCRCSIHCAPTASRPCASPPIWRTGSAGDRAPPAHGLPSAVVYRMPNNKAVAKGDQPHPGRL